MWALVLVGGLFVLCVGVVSFFQRQRGFGVPPTGAAVLISGAGTGFGRLTAYSMARKGYKVFAGVLNDAEGEKLLKEFKEQNFEGEISTVVFDITKEQQVQSTYDKLTTELADQGLQMLVNNAGVALGGGPMELVPVEDFERVIQINLIGHVRVTKKMLPLMRKAKNPRIVNVTSIAGKVAAKYMSSYCSSKFAMEAFTDSLRRELRGFAVSAIEPGFAKTGIIQDGHNYVLDQFQKAPEALRKFYEDAVNSMDQHQGTIWNTAMDPQYVVDQIVDALTNPNPKIRYTVGIQAKSVAFLAWLLPDRILDYIFSKV